MNKLHTFLLLTALALPLVGAAQDEEIDPREIREAEMAQVFKSGMAGIVDDMNRGSFHRYVMAIDQDDLFERIFGLRLISQRLKRDWREQQEQRFPDFIAGLYANESEDGMKATLLNVESRGNRGRAIVRFDMTFFRVNYVEYELRLDDKDRLIIVDWIDYLWGHRFTEYAGLMLVSAHPLESAVRKLFDYPNVSQAELFEMTELLKTSRDLNYQRYMQIFDRLDEKVKRQWVALKVGIDVTRIRMKRREQRRILEAIAKYHPDDALFSLALLDYYLPTQQYALAEEGLKRLQDKLSIDDAMMNARLSSIALVMKRPDEADVLALKAVDQEPTLELGWWSVLRAKAAMGQYDEAVRALDKLERDFGHELGPDKLNREADLRGLVRSAEYQSWIAAKS